MLKESIGHTLLSISPLRTKGNLKFPLDSQWHYWTTLIQQV